MGRDIGLEYRKLSMVHIYFSRTPTIDLEDLTHICTYNLTISES